MNSPTTSVIKRPRALSAGTLLRRDWRSGELGIVLAAVVLAVAVVVGISAFVGRLQSALESESLRFLAADRVVASSIAVPNAWREEARALGLETAKLLEFSSMAMTDGDAMALASVKAASDGYPLRGVLQTSLEPYGVVSESRSIPEPGQVWIAPRLFALLNVTLGDRLWIGEKALTVAGTVRSEPDAGGSFFGLGPRVLMNLADIEATGVVQPGSRVTYRLLLRGELSALESFVTWVEPRLVQGQRLLGLDESQPRLGRTLDRARGFLLLAGSLGVILAAAAIALAARRFAERHTDPVAVMKSLGASRGQISALYGQSLLLLGVIAAGLGVIVGWIIQAGFFQVFAAQIGVEPGPAGWRPYVMGAVTALVCLSFFAWPPLARLSQVPPLRVLRRDVDVGSAQRGRDYALGGAAIIALMAWYAGDLQLTAGVVLGLAVTLAVGYVLARVLLKGSRVAGSSAGSIWRLAMAGLQRRRQGNALQMVIFGLAIMMMLLLLMVRTSLLDQWRAQLPAGTPNHFLLNLAPDQRDALSRFFADRDIVSEPRYPMTRGRVMAVNGQALAERRNAEDGPRQREANFTHSAQNPSGNALLEGRWWPADTEQAEVSLEQGFAADIGASLDDVLTIRIGAAEFDVTVTSIREVDWQSMKPNFFAIFPSKVLESHPKMYMTSFFLPAERKSDLNQLLRAFPTLTIIELDTVIREIQTIIERVGQAIELVLAVILVAGALVLIAGVRASVDTRLRESALLRALGARRGLLLGALWIEFATLGGCAGLLAVIGAEAAAWALQTRALDLAYTPSLALWPLGLAAGVLLIGVLGVFSCRRAVSVPPLVVLREL